MERYQYPTKSIYCFLKKENMLQVLPRLAFLLSSCFSLNSHQNMDVSEDNHLLLCSEVRKSVQGIFTDL